MSARPHDVMYTPELRDFADIESDAYVDALILKVEQLRDLRQTVNSARRLIEDHRAEIRRLEALIGNTQADIDRITQEPARA